MSEANDMIAEAFSVLTDEAICHGVRLITPDRREVTGIVSPVGLQPDSERLEERFSSSVMLTIDRSFFNGSVPKSGSFTDIKTGSSYRIGAVENLPARPGIEFICEHVEKAEPV